MLRNLLGLPGRSALPEGNDGLGLRRMDVWFGGQKTVHSPLPQVIAWDFFALRPTALELAGLCSFVKTVGSERCQRRIFRPLFSTASHFDEFHPRRPGITKGGCRNRLPALLLRYASAE